MGVLIAGALNGVLCYVIGSVTGTDPFLLTGVSVLGGIMYKIGMEVPVE